MATIYYSLSKKTDKASGKCEILTRFVVGSRINQRAKTGLYVLADKWDESKQAAKLPRVRIMSEEEKELAKSLNELNTTLQGIRAAVLDAYLADGAGKKALPAGWLASTIDKYLHPEDYREIEEKRYLLDAFAGYIADSRLAPQRVKNTQVVERSLARFEAYKGQRLELDTVTADDIRVFEKYMRNEAEIVKKRPALLKVRPESRQIEARSENTIIDRMKILRAVLYWEIQNGHTTNNPFARVSVGEAVYGTPYYITVEERNALYSFDLSAHPALAVQRDIFVFQCLVGCRVSDMLKLKRANLIAGGIEYVPAKTKDEHPTTVRVPLNSIAAEIVDRYADTERAALLPFISAQKYNNAIKEIFRLAGLTRPVTVLDPMTRQEVQRPLNEIASSHLARRTFVGNLYKQVKDPNLIAKLSGHVEGSKAFARYRDIDESMRVDLVKLLEK